MNFPFFPLPLPPSLAEMELFVNMHQLGGLLAGGVFAFFGFFLLLLWVPKKKEVMKESIKESIIWNVRTGYGFLGLAALFFFLGLYGVAILILAVLVAFVTVFIKGIPIALGKTTEEN